MTALTYVLTIDNAFDVILTRVTDGKQVVVSTDLVGQLVFEAAGADD